jgi:nitrate/TMAO reductase-like tetraheme cytochrome c subunit
MNKTKMKVIMRDSIIKQKPVALIAWVFLVSMIFAAAAAGAAESVSNDICLSCHSTPGLEKLRQGKKVSLSVDSERFSKSAHGPLPCTACHSDITQVPHAPDLKRVECAQCHAKVAETYADSVHGRASRNGDGDAARCSDCHGKHDIVAPTNPQSKVYPLQLPYTCGACHGDPALAKKHNIPVTNAYKLYMDSIHGQALEKSGLLVAANCSSCHGSHDIRPKLDPKSKVNHANVPSTCGACHGGILSDYFTGVHGRAVKEGNAAAPVCIDCHSAHEIRRVETAGWKLDIVKECGTCHRESLRTYRDTFHGQVTALGFVRVARCSDCHGSHKILPARNPQSSIAPARLVSTCQKCHPQANATFAQFSPHADYADKQRNPSLYYAAIFMKALLAGVFIFFGLHTCLWLVRSIIEVWSRKRLG